MAGRHDASVQMLVNIPNIPGGPKLLKLVSKPVPPDKTWGTLTALNLTDGGRMLWQVKMPQPLVGGTLATAGGVVFTGETNGRFDAFDAATGEALWTYQTGGSIGAPPMSYMAKGRQFVAVAAGPASSGGPARSGAIRAFALP